jgi:Helix-turn-helix.|nr:MAG TPA: Repressor protein CI [Caudoviricetes sp.]
MARPSLSEYDKKLRRTISENLKRLTSNYTQQQLSEMTGIPVSTLSGYFAQRSTPNAGNVQKIADALHVQKSDIDPRFSPKALKSESSYVDTNNLLEDSRFISLQRNYNNLSDADKDALLRYMEFLVLENKGR